MAVNENVDVKQAERIQECSTKAVYSLSASLVFGRDSARQIALPLLTALFSLTSNNYHQALGVIIKIDDFSVKRVFLEQFKHSYLLNTGSKDLSALVEEADCSDQQMSDRYYSALLKLFNENNKDIALLSKNLRVLPITARRLALKRLSSKEFEEYKRVKITRKKFKVFQNQRPINDSEPLIKTWHWVLIFIVIATLAIAYG